MKNIFTKIIYRDFIKIFAIIFFALQYNISFAQDTTYPLNFINGLQGVINLIIPLLIGISIVVFIWGIIRYMAHADNQEDRAAGKSLMIYGITALFVVVSIWGIIAILQQLTGTVGIDDPGIVPIIPTY